MREFAAFSIYYYCKLNILGFPFGLLEPFSLLSYLRD